MVPEVRLRNLEAMRAAIRTAFATRRLPESSKALRSAVEGDGEQLRKALNSLASDASPAQIAAALEGKLWMLEAATFRYYLPTLLQAIVNNPIVQSPIAAELVDALTPPKREDIEEMLDQLDQAPIEGLLDPDVSRHLRGSLLQQFDSGTPSALFLERCEELNPAEGAAILSVLRDLQSWRELDYFGPSITRAIARWWSRFAKTDAR